MPRKTKTSSVAKGQTGYAVKANPHLPSATDSPSLTGGQPCYAVSALAIVPPVSDLNRVLSHIRGEHKTRCFAIETRKCVDLRMGAFIRSQLGWRNDLPEAERKEIEKRAAAMLKEPTGSEWESVITGNIASRAPFDQVEAVSVKAMSALAETLPAWDSFGKPIRGFGVMSFATIIAEAGDLSNYSNHSKLWKRMGLAVMDGLRQGGLPKGSDAQAWIDHGYNKLRRSRMWNIGDTIIKAQVRKVKDAAGEDTGERVSLGKYGAVYLARKEFELARDPDIAPIKAHRRAQRVMEKRLLRDLWRAWRRAGGAVSETTIITLPVAPLKNAA